MNGTIRQGKGWEGQMKHEVHAAEPVDFELDIPDIEHFPLDRWEGQTINMVPGAY